MKLPNDDDGGVSEVLPGMKDPLWEGRDDEFAAYATETFGIPPAETLVVTITRPSPSGKCAVGIGDSAGAILLVITPNYPTSRKTHIRPVIMGPWCSQPEIVERAKASSGDANSTAITNLALRHLSREVVMSLLLPPQVH